MTEVRNNHFNIFYIFYAFWSEQSACTNNFYRIKIKLAHQHLMDELGGRVWEWILKLKWQRGGAINTKERNDILSGRKAESEIMKHPVINILSSLNR